MMTRLELAVLVGIASTANIVSACARNADASPSAQGASPVSSLDAGADRGAAERTVPDLATAVKTAGLWLSALRQRDRSGLLQHSGVPFVVRDASGNGPCSNLEISDSGKLDSIGCLVDDGALRAALKENPDPDIGPLSAKHLPNWARGWRADVVAGLRPLGVVLLGHKISFDLVILVGADGVHGVFKHTAADRN